MTFKDAIESDILKTHLNDDEFGEIVNYNPITGSAFDIQVIWDDAYEGVDTESGQIVNSRQPKITAKTSDFANEPVQGDIVTRNSIQYKVSKHLPDGAGISEIILQKAN